MKKETKGKERKVRQENRVKSGNKAKKSDKIKEEFEYEEFDEEDEISDDDDTDDDDDDDLIDKRKTKSKGKGKGKGKNKRKRRKIIIVIVAVLIVVIVLVIGLWGMHGSTSYPTVSEILEDKDKNLDKDIEVKGTVKLDSINLTIRNFIITDGKNDLNVTYTDSLPSNFEEGKEVVVKGKLIESAQYGLVVEADEIVVGCASKY